MRARRPPLRVLLVDDHALFRAGLRSLLERDLGAEITAECANATEALLALAQAVPDVALLDISLRDGDGIELTRRIHGDFGGAVRCVMVSMHATAAYVLQAFAAGAQAYVLKDSGPAELVSAVHAVMAGQRYVSPGVSGHLVDSLQRSGSPAPHDALSSRQLDVLRRVAQGQSTKLIARELGLSARTVDSHRYQISQRLGLHDVASMVRYALRHDLARADA